MHSRLFVIGSFRSGGAGKTPVTLWFAKELLEKGKTVAILCHEKAFDEFNLLQNALPEGKIFKTRNRHATALQLDGQFDYILCDDGFEDSRLTGATIIRLDWETPPTRYRDLLPLGKFRSLPSDHPEVTGLVIPCTSANFPQQKLKVPPGLPTLAICGLGDPNRFFQDLKSQGIALAKTVARPDHDRKFPKFVQKYLTQGYQVILTEKDSARLPQDLLQDQNLHIAYQKVEFSSEIREKMVKFGTL